jgi:CHAT domain-containing protein
LVAAGAPPVRGVAGETVARLAPQVLCGLALAGANASPDGSGRHPGIATAEELAAVDLTGCELVVLSACEGAAGADVRGRGVASLRAALRAAGARCVVAASWRVGDEATRALMADFYERLLRQPAGQRDPHAALWQARLAAKERGAEFRDWAGWNAIGR